ncbi:MAG TPA: glycosyltransferase family 39 protein, partial [Candidatus Nanoarchaeia archaeon]|nr:glycosyltransferase family 39 protein [Candidatus Nanoarchaeia archaeon]
SFMFGDGTATLRMVSLVFGLLNIFLTYVLAKKLLGKKEAIIAAVLMTVSYWHLFESYMLERDGSFLMTFYLLSILSYLAWKETKKPQWFAALAILCGTSLLLKASGIFITGMIALFLITDTGWNVFKYKKGQYMRLVEYISIIITADIVIYGSLLVAAHRFAPILYQGMFSHAIPLNLLSITPLTFFRELGYLFLWGSPVMLGLCVLSEKKKHVKYIYLWMLTVLAGYMTVSYAGSLDRYLSVLIPAMSILAATTLASNKLQNKARYIITGVVYFIFLNIIASQNYEYITHSIKEYGTRALSFNWNFYFPMYGAGGPSFLIPFSTIAISCALIGALCVLTMVNKKFFWYFVAIGFAFNLFVIQEFSVHAHSVDVSDATYAAIDYYNTDYDSSSDSIIYTNGYGVPSYLNKSMVAWVRCRESDTACWNSVEKKLTTQDGAFIFIDFPKYSEESTVKKTLKRCSYLKNFDSLNISQVYRCSHENV